MTSPDPDDVEARLGARARPAGPAGPLFDPPAPAPAASLPWRAAALSILRRVARERETFASDDVRECMTDLLADPDAPAAAWARVFREALEAGEIERTGETRPSRRADQAGVDLPLYRLTARGRALAAPPTVVGIVCGKGGCRQVKLGGTPTPRPWTADVPFPAEQLSRCSGCDAPIGWVVRADDEDGVRRHPVEARGYAGELAPLGLPRGSLTRSGWTLEGRVVRIIPSSTPPFMVVFESHFIACPKAHRFRRRTP